MIVRQTDRHRHTDTHIPFMVTKVTESENKVSQRHPLGTQDSSNSSEHNLKLPLCPPSIWAVGQKQNNHEIGVCFQFQVPSHPQTQLVSLDQVTEQFWASVSPSGKMK